MNRRSFIRSLASTLLVAATPAVLDVARLFTRKPVPERGPLGMKPRYQLGMGLARGAILIDAPSTRILYSADHGVTWSTVAREGNTPVKLSGLEGEPGSATLYEMDDTGTLRVWLV